MGYAFEGQFQHGAARQTAKGLLRLETDEEAAAARRAARRARLRRQAQRNNAAWTACAGIMLIAGIVMTAGSQAAHWWHSLGQTESSVKTVIAVSPGDTLWGVAQKYGDPEADLNQEVADLAAANAISPYSALTPGQRLTVTVTNPVIVTQLQKVQETRIARN